ncbi:MAG: peroxiredoxin, partial [Ignisphaera sp.]
VFIVDPEGVIRAILYYPQEAGRNMDEILRLLKVLQLNTQYKRAFPANWPNNELVKDAVIVPPATSIQDAQERLKMYKCLDWWFCCEEGKVPADEVAEVRRWLERVAKSPT